MKRLSAEQLKIQETMTLPQILESHALTLAPASIAIREKSFGIWNRITWQDYAGFVKYTALGLKGLGFRRDDKLAIVMDNHSEWLFSELAAQALGGISVALFTSSMASELVRVLQRVKARFAVVQDQEQVDKLLECRDRLPYLERVIYVDPTSMRPYGDNEWLLGFSQLLEQGKKAHDDDPSAYAAELKKGNPDDIALMIPTSGTTGLPKLVMLTHRNFVAAGHQWIAIVNPEIGSNWISISPPSWIVDKMWGLGVSLASAMTMNFPDTGETMTQDFRELGPEILITPSRFWEELASRVASKNADSGPVKRWMVSRALRTGEMVEDLAREGKNPPLLLSLQRLFWSTLVCRPLLGQIGCLRLKTAFAGGHPLSPDVFRFFRSLGLNLKQCYGLVEAGGMIIVQPDDQPRDGTAGVPLPDARVAVSEDDDEILLSGKTIFRGYFDDFEATEASFRDGWFRTGDCGYIDEDGHLVVIGRKEELIRDKQGRVFSPLSIETRLNASSYIQEAVICGDGRPHISALVTIDMDKVGAWAESQDIPFTGYTDLSRRGQVEALIGEEIRRVNEALPDHMRIRKFILLYKPLDADDDELTRTGKVRRHFVYSLYMKLIEAMYGSERELDVKGQIRYRDGRTGTIETTVRILDVG